MTRRLSSRTTGWLAACAVATLGATALSAAPAYAEPVEHVSNGTFETAVDPWWGTENTPVSVDEGRLCAQAPGAQENPWDAAIGYSDVPLVNRAPYTLKFTASASAPVTVKAIVQLNEEPYTAALSRDIELTAEAQEFAFEFAGNVESANGVLTFQLGGPAEDFTVCLDDVSLASDDVAPANPDGPEQLTNGGFDNGTNNWFSYETAPIAVVDGRLCAEVPGGTANAWDAGIGQNNIYLTEGGAYRLSLSASADPPATIRVTVQENVEPFTAATNQVLALTAEPQTFEFDFTSPLATETAQLVFQVGGAEEASTICVDDVSMRGGEEQPPYQPETGARVRVNQVGYLPTGPKNATIVTESTEALAWELKNADGAVVAEGRSTPRGMDSASGQNTHTVDFSDVTTVGTGYTLTADGETSYPFDISPDLYSQLRSDAMQFFYIQRSGIEIDGDLVGEEYARPAGHLGVAPNKGDTDVPCQEGVCDYRLDVRGGWYDAGDHGKYVVNGGISTAQLLGTYERAKYAPSARGGADLADGTLRLPEAGNDVPDILDEARWELEFLMRMQVPAGEPLAGMAHHKMHDDVWTALPMQPHEDPQQRELHPPSTAATLNLAAAAAQGSRLFAEFDAEFAAQALAAAETAYAAAKANPRMLADPTDGTGGGAYSDNDVSDEFYWAAAELYLTTGEAAYWTDVTGSEHHTSDEVFGSGGFGWGGTAALGRLDLATVPSEISEQELARIRASVVEAADAYLATVADEAYGLPMPGNADHYFWGANGNLMNNAIVMATAFDLTGDVKYRDGAVQSMDYIFGRNALNHSYVTGWGEKHSVNQHSRIFANQVDESLPNPPAGSISGGANAALQDPYATELLAGCAPMFCFVDHIDSYATNEVAINWNAPLAWMASFLDDQGAAALRPGA